MQKIIALILIQAAFVLLLVIAQPIDGEHYGRQALAQSQIEKTLQDGEWIRPATYNHRVPPLMYEVPLFQWIVAGLCSFFPISPLVCARAVNIALCMLALECFRRILRKLKIDSLAGVLTLALATTSPLLLHYYSVPLSDPLATTLSLAAFWGYLNACEAQSQQRRAWSIALLISSTTLVALIKCTVLVPIGFAVLFHALRNIRTRKSAALYLALASVAGAAAFLIIKNMANGSSQTPNDRLSWLLGSIADRFDHQAWQSLSRSFSELILASPAAVAAAVGVMILSLRRTRSDLDATALAWATGAILYVLTFFHLHVVHSYYQLPIVFPAALAAGLAISPLIRYLFSLWIPRSAIYLVSLALALLLVRSGWHTLSCLRHPHAELARLRGAWIQQTSDQSCFVIYLTTPNHESNEHLLYSCQRNGFNLRMDILEQAGVAFMLDIVSSYAIADDGSPRYDTIAVYASPEFSERASLALQSIPGLVISRSSEFGDLYSYQLRRTL